MKNIFVNTVLYLGLLFCLSCKVNSNNPGKFHKRQIAVGSYGGFAGTNEKLILLRNGKVYVSVIVPGLEPINKYLKKIPRKQARKMFHTIDKVDFTTLKRTPPGNMNFYIERNRWIRKDESYTWQMELDSLDKNLKLISTLLNF